MKIGQASVVDSDPHVLRNVQNQMKITFSNLDYESSLQLLMEIAHES